MCDLVDRILMIVLDLVGHANERIIADLANISADTMQ